MENLGGASRPRAVQAGTRTLNMASCAHTLHPSSIVQCPKMIDALGRAQVMPMNDYLGFWKKKKKKNMKKEMRSRRRLPPPGRANWHPDTGLGARPQPRTTRASPLALNGAPGTGRRAPTWGGVGSSKLPGPRNRKMAPWLMAFSRFLWDSFFFFFFFFFFFWKKMNFLGVEKKKNKCLGGKMRFVFEDVLFFIFVCAEFFNFCVLELFFLMIFRRFAIVLSRFCRFLALFYWCEASFYRFSPILALF
jgi:hypothetical protein